MERKQLSFEQVFDLRAVRIIAATVADCYAALGLVHGRFTYIPGEFDDYIATPKDNFYRSIHTAVLGPEGKAVEVQIRTREMHDQAELGLAAHWRYKESRAHDVSYDRKIEWVRQLLATERQDAEGQRDFLDAVRAELFEDRVYALTPKGEVVDLPPGGDAARLRLPRAHRSRASLPRSPGQWTHRAADPRAGQRRGGRNPHAQASAAQPGLVVRDLGLSRQSAQPLQGARLVPEVRRGRRQAGAAGHPGRAGGRAARHGARPGRASRHVPRCCWGASRTCPSAWPAAAPR